MSRGVPKKPENGGQQQQAKATGNPTPVIKQPSGTDGQQSHACPNTHQNKYDCNTISAIANVRQADAAEWFNGAATVEIGVGLVTAGVAYFAAKFASDAVKAARETLSHEKERTKAELRPWIGFSSFETGYYHSGGFVDGVKVPRVLYASIGLINTGQSPAIDARTVIRHKVTDSNVVDPPFFEVVPDPKRVGSSAAGPQRAFNTASRAVGPPDCDRLLARTACLWLYTETVYDGPGGKDGEYRTTVMLRVTLESMGKQPDGNPNPIFNGNMLAGTMI